MLTNSLRTIESIIQKVPNNFLIVIFRVSWGGSILSRILSSHDEFFSYPQSMLQQNDYNDPIRYPDSMEGFFHQFDHGLSFTEQHLSCAHLGSGAPWGNLNEDIKLYFNALNSNKIIPLRSHNTKLLTDERFQKVRFINVIGSRIERNLSDLSKNRSSSDSIDWLPVELHRSNILNYDLSLLLNEDYDSFLDSYIELITWLDLTPKINSVRSFILLWLEKQKRYKQFLDRKSNL